MFRRAALTISSLLLLLALMLVSVSAQDRRGEVFPDVPLGDNMMYVMVSRGYVPVGEADWVRAYLFTKDQLLPRLNSGGNSWPFYWQQGATGGDWLVEPNITAYQLHCLLVAGWDAVKHDLRCTNPVATATPPPSKPATTQTPEVTAEATSEVTPEVTAEVTPEPTVEVTVEVTPEITPEVTPEVTPEPTPEPTPFPAIQSELCIFVHADAFRYFKGICYSNVSPARWGDAYFAEVKFTVIKEMTPFGECSFVPPTGWRGSDYQTNDTDSWTWTFQQHEADILPQGHILRIECPSSQGLQVGERVVQ